ncbi:hypothetical protein MKX03_023905 [Papaver bracteatum]|nr:hypothetical protein MKX03_023905 [Papaver bracteatum]
MHHSMLGESRTPNMDTSQSRFAARINRMTEEQRAAETERLRVRDKQRQPKLDS